MNLISNTPNHQRIWPVLPGMSLSILVRARILALVVRPNILSFATAHVSLEHSLEQALAFTDFNRSFSTKSSAFIPGASEYTLTDFDLTLAEEFTLGSAIVRRCRPVAHRQQFTILERVVVPGALYFGDIAVVCECHNAFTV